MILKNSNRPLRHPLVGFYVNPEPNPQRRFGEQTAMLKELSKIGSQRGVDVVILIPGYVKHQEGYRYDALKGSFVRTRVSMPDIVLRRSGAFRGKDKAVSEDLAYFKATGRLHSLPRISSNKWVFYRVVRDEPDFAEHIPQATLAGSAAQVYRLLHRYQDVYVKPINGAQGISVYHLFLKHHQPVVSWEERIVPRKTERISNVFAPHTRINEQLLGGWVEFEKFWISTGLRRCLVQETISLLKTEGNRPFDFRWLVQNSEHPEVIARVARVGNENAVTTNIHTGGQAVPADVTLKKSTQRDVKETLAKMDEVAYKLVAILRNKYGPFAEVGVDMGLNRNGKIFVFEINPTPGRRMLRSLPGHVRQLSLVKLIEYAMRATGFSHASDQ